MNQDITPVLPVPPPSPLNTTHTHHQKVGTRRDTEAQRSVLETTGMAARALSKPRRGPWGPSRHPYPLPFSLPHTQLWELEGEAMGMGVR